MPPSRVPAGTGRHNRPRPRPPKGRPAAGEALKIGVFETARDAVLISDAGGRILAFNPAAERLFGWTAAEALGLRLTDLVTSPGAGAGRPGPHDILGGAGGRLHLDGRTKEGAAVPVELAVHRAGPDDEPLYIAYARTPQEVRGAPAPAARQRDQLERMRAAGALLSGVAHELNNPLAILVAQSTLLRDKAPTPDVARRAEKIRAAADRAGRIVKSFLAMARQTAPVLAPVEVADLVDAGLETVEHELRAAGIALERRLPRGPLTAEGDRDLLGQVIIHLVTGARLALLERPGQGRIVVSSAREAGRVAIEIRDNGAPASAAAGAGRGVGLSLCRAVIEAHGGELTFGHAGGENLARFTLPALAGAAPAPRNGPAPGSLSVLVVDDEVDVAQSLAELIEVLGHRAAVETSAEAALDRIARGRVDVVFTDFRMPGMDGGTLRRAIAALAPGLAARTVMVTGDTVSMAFDRGHPATEPGTLTLVKPFTARDVKALLDQVAAS